MKEGNSVACHVVTLRGLLEQLAIANAPDSDHQAKLRLLCTMPTNYQGFITSLRGQQCLTLANVITVLLQEEIILKVVGQLVDQVTVLAITNCLGYH